MSDADPATFHSPPPPTSGAATESLAERCDPIGDGISTADLCVPGNEASRKNTEYARAKELLEKVAVGKEATGGKALPAGMRLSPYASALVTYLSRQLRVSKTEAVAIGLSAYLRQLDQRTLATENDIAVLIHQLQFAVQDLAWEVVQLQESTGQVVDRESFTLDPEQETETQ